MNTSKEPAVSVETEGAGQTLALGEALGARLFAGAVVGLVGDLGAGKTVLAKGIARGLGVADVAQVVSPTFTFLNVHAGRLPLYHFDAYRLADANGFVDLGVEEYLAGEGVCVIEWADRVAAALPADRLEVCLSHRSGDRRRIELYCGPGSRFRKIVSDATKG